MRVWINGHLAPAGTTGTIDALDQGFSVGHGVFQTLKVIDGVPFALNRHLSRLMDHSARVGLPLPAHDQVEAGVESVLTALEADLGPVPLGRMRITWTAGAAAPGPAAATGAGTLVVQAGVMQPYGPTASAVQVPFVRNERGALTGIKSVSFGENRVALAHAQAAGADEAVFANTRGDLCEGATSNIFYVHRGQLLTPTVASGCLPGVTRELVLAHTEAVEADAPIGVLDGADEILLTSTTRAVQPVTSWNGTRLPPGPVAARLAALFADLEHHGTGA